MIVLAKSGNRRYDLLTKYINAPCPGESLQKEDSNYGHNSTDVCQRQSTPSHEFALWS